MNGALYAPLDGTGVYHPLGWWLGLSCHNTNIRHRVPYTKSAGARWIAYSTDPRGRHSYKRNATIWSRICIITVPLAANAQEKEQKRACATSRAPMPHPLTEFQETWRRSASLRIQFEVATYLPKSRQPCQGALRACTRYSYSLLPPSNPAEVETRPAAHLSVARFTSLFKGSKVERAARERAGDRALLSAASRDDRCSSHRLAPPTSSCIVLHRLARRVMWRSHFRRAPGGWHASRLAIRQAELGIEGGDDHAHGAGDH